MKYRLYIVLILLVTLLAGCSNAATVTVPDPTPSPAETAKAEAAAGEGTPQAAAPKETVPEVVTPKVQTITIGAIGDILVSANCLVWAKDGDKYDFDPPFSEVMPVIQSADLAIANLETVTAGPDARYTGMPRFNSPDSILDTLKKSGFDVIVTANNHCADRGSAGIVRTIDQLDARGILHTGTYKTKEDSEKILITDVKGIKVAVLAYTASTNGIPYQQPCVVNSMRMDKMQSDIKKARELKADVIIVHLHTGVEYARQPSKSQINLSHSLVEAGADIVLSEHPHVLQPMERITVTDDSGQKRDGLIFYSLGNFINQGGDIYKNLAAVFNITIEKEMATGVTSIKETEIIPTWLQIYKKEGRGSYRVIPVKVAIEKYENKQDKYISEKEYKLLKKMLPEILDHVNKGPVN